MVKGKKKKKETDRERDRSEKKNKRKTKGKQKENTCLTSPFNLLLFPLLRCTKAIVPLSKL